MNQIKISRSTVYYQFISGIDTNAARIGDTLTACKDSEGWHILNDAGAWYFCPVSTLRIELENATEILKVEQMPDLAKYTAPVKLWQGDSFGDPITDRNGQPLNAEPFNPDQIDTEKKPNQETTTNPDTARKESPKAYTPDTIKLYHICYDGLMSGCHKISPDRLKNFTLEFFADFLECAKRSARLGVASYEPIFNHPFYTVSGSEYCQFLEVFYSLDYWRSLLEDAKTKKAIKAFKNFILSDDADIATLHTELINIFGDLETADGWKFDQIGRLPEGVSFSDYVLRA